MRTAAAVAALLAATGCAGHEDHVADANARAAEYIAQLPTGDDDPRAGMLRGFVMVTEDMVRSHDPVEAHVDAMTVRQACMMAAYGMRGIERRKEAIENLTGSPERHGRWWRYVVLSSGRPSVPPTEEACNY